MKTVGRHVLLALVVLIGACSQQIVTAPPPAPPPSGPSAPELAVSRLFESLASGDYATAADLTVPRQMVVVALAEGSSVGTANTLLEDGELQVGERFWESFAASLSGFLGYSAREVRIGAVTEYSVSGEDFALVEATVPLEAGVRRIIVKRQNGWRVDVIASFASALVPKIAPAGEIVRADPDGGDLLSLMQEQEPSLEMVLSEPGLSAQMQQAVFQALEVLRR